ncbi:MAG TPA: sialidase family protein [Candidatus Baltobacteraceae bacterium]|nr:sialidase family protein [Candidatus Baltobacteraceae bacterium]
MRWQQVGPSATTGGKTFAGEKRVNVTGRVTAIVVKGDDANTLFVGTARGGVWRSKDRGATWEPTSDGHTSLAIGALAAAPSDPHTLYAGTGEGNLCVSCQLATKGANDSFVRPESLYGNGLLVSRDAGDTWTEYAADVFTRGAFFRLAVDPDNSALVYAASTLGIHRSSDGGETWLPMGGLPDISTTTPAATDILIDPDDSHTLYAAFWTNGIYRTTNAYDDAPQWECILGPGAVRGGFGRIALAATPRQDRLWCLLADSEGGNVAALLHTPKASPGTWTSVLPKAMPFLEDFAYYCLVLAPDPRDPNTIYAGAVNLRSFSFDPAHNTWTSGDIGNDLHEDHHAVVFDPHDQRTIYFGNDGGIFRSTDGGKTTNDSINKGLCTLEVTSVARFPKAQTIILGTHDNGAQLLQGVTANAVGDGDFGAVAVDPYDAQLAYVVLDVPYKSTNAGVAWDSFVALKDGLKGKTAFYPPFDIDPTNSNNIAFGAAPFVNVDPAKGANSWPTNIELDGITGDITALTFVNSNLILVGTSACEVYYVNQNAGKWDALAVSPPLNPVSNWVCDIKPLTPDGSSFIIALSGYDTPHVWRADITPPPVTAKWSNISGVGPGALPNSPATALAVDGRTIFAGTDLGIYTTTDGGATWSRNSDGLPNAGINQLLLDEANHVILAATNGRGIWQLPI